MKILRKPVKAIVECSLCNCEYEISGKDWRRIEHSRYEHLNNYVSHCPNCKHPMKIIPGEVKCAK